MVEARLPRRQARVEQRAQIAGRRGEHRAHHPIERALRGVRRGRTSAGLTAPGETPPGVVYGLMLWLLRNTLSGSYRLFRDASRS